MAEHPGTGERDLAKVLGNLGKVLGDLGLREQAIATVRESIGLLRALAGVPPEVYRLELANSLNALAVLLDGSGRSEEALAAVRETLEIRQDLARLRPSMEPDLAATFVNLSVILSALHRPEEALFPLREGIDIFRRLAADRPKAFQDGLATSLYSLGNLLRELERTDEALGELEEAVALWRALASWRPVFNIRLAAGLEGLGEALAALGWNERAGEALGEAVEIGRRLDREQPGVHRDVLALSLHHMSLRLRERGDLREAMDRSEEAIRLLLPLAEACPEAHGEGLAEMRQEYRRTATAAGIEPAPELL